MEDGLTGDKKILAEAKKRFETCISAGTKIRESALDDLKFFRGLREDQWSASAIKERELDRRPCPVINKLPASCKTVINSIRQNKPSLKFRPVDSAVDVKTAEVINGIVRHIQNNTDSKSAIDLAIQYGVICGQGWFRVLTAHMDPMSMDQDILVQPIANPLSVYVPFHLCHATDLSDMPYAFVRISMSRDDFKLKYGKKAEEEIAEWDTTGEGDSSWTDGDDSIWLAEYFTIEEEYKTLYQLSDGTTTLEKPEDGLIVTNELGMAQAGPTVVAQRETCIKKVMWRLISEATVLESKEFPSKYIPLIPVLGWELNVDGERDYLSLIRHAKDPQVLYNYYKAMESETISLSPKSPWVMAAGQVEGFEDSWKTANQKNHTYLEYNQIDARGQVAPPPQRMGPPQVPSAAVNAMREASEDIQVTTGIFNANLGQQGNETSGRGIIARQKMGDNSVWNYTDSVTRAVKQMGRIFVDLIPKIFDVPRSVHVLGEDMTDDVVMVNQMYFDPEQGENVLYDMTAGKYDVSVEVGPSYESKRMEVAENISNLLQAVPQIGQVASDILVRNLDFPGATELADRLKRTVPPQLLEDPNSKPNKISEAEIQMIVQDLQGLQQQLQMAGQEKQQMMQVIQRYEGMLKDKEADRQVKLVTEKMRSDTAMRTNHAKLMQEKMRNEQEDEMTEINMAMKISESRSAAEANLSQRYQPTAPTQTVED